LFGVAILSRRPHPSASRPKIISASRAGRES
jgi:hypothetical protein